MGELRFTNDFSIKTIVSENELQIVKCGQCITHYVCPLTVNGIGYF